MNWLLRSALLTLAWLPFAAAYAAEGLIQTQSPYSVEETIDRFEEVAQERGLTLFARIDHAAGAETVDQMLRPTEVLIFGNPQGGTPFMQCAQTVGIDLPLKVLAWEDDKGQVWLGYNDPVYLAQRHQVSDCPVVENLSNALSNLVDATTAN